MCVCVCVCVCVKLIKFKHIIYYYQLKYQLCCSNTEYRLIDDNGRDALDSKRNPVHTSNWYNSNVGKSFLSAIYDILSQT